MRHDDAPDHARANPPAGLVHQLQLSGGVEVLGAKGLPQDTYIRDSNSLSITYNSLPYPVVTDKICNIIKTATGRVRTYAAETNGFQVHPLNHSGTVARRPMTNDPSQVSLCLKLDPLTFAKFVPRLWDVPA